MAKTQRVRDPVHNLIEFGRPQLERMLWDVIQSEPFQRLRRIRQLGFSEYVFPGATHTRFAHSIGVFHVARQLTSLIDRYVKEHSGDERSHQPQVAQAAALVHDVGHGMFSHSFEAVGKKLKIPMARHEEVSKAIILDSEITEVFRKEFGAGFATDVANLIGSKAPGTLYDAVVSSQFDADRLDYMHRDKMMTGVQSSGIDLTWLMANIEVASVQTGTDELGTGSVETLILGPKAVQAAESYVLSLFHLYPNVYLHKTTRGAEKIFSELIMRIVLLVRDGLAAKTGLPVNHPICLFSLDASLSNVLKLDDAVFWGSLGLLTEAEDKCVSFLARSLRDRRLPQCIDIRRRVEDSIEKKSGEPREKWKARVTLACSNIENALSKGCGQNKDDVPNVLLDHYERAPYKSYEDSDSPLNRILIRIGEGGPRDITEISPVIAAAENFAISRAYIWRGDTSTNSMIENEIRTCVLGAQNGEA